MSSANDRRPPVGGHSPAGQPRSIAVRKLKSRIFDGLMWAAGVVALVPLVLIVYYVLANGIPVLTADFFTQTAPPPGLPGGGMSQAMAGSAMMVGMSVLISVPLGILTAIYLSEYGRGRLASATRFVAEILLSTPSIVAGAFIWAVVVTAMHSFSAIAGSIALTVLMWPIITRGAEETLRLVPDDLREAALALGAPRWKMILRVVLPTAGPGIFTAVMLSIARGLGETAPILLTALGNDFMNLDPAQPTDAVPLRIYNYAQSPIVAWHDFAWGGAIVLLAVVLTLSIGARILSDRQQRRLR
jgi:phosphate transport system permease protein